MDRTGKKGLEYGTRAGGTMSGVNKGTKHGAGPNTPHKAPKVRAGRKGGRK